MIPENLFKIDLNESIEHIHEIALAYTIEQYRRAENENWTVCEFYDCYKKMCQELISYTQK